MLPIREKTDDVIADISMLFFDAVISMLFFDAVCEHFERENNKLSKFNIERFINAHVKEYKKEQILYVLAFNFYYDEKESTFLGEKLEKGEKWYDFYDFGKYKKIIEILINYQKENTPEKRKKLREAETKLVNLCFDFAKTEKKLESNTQKFVQEVLETVKGL